MTLLTPMTGEMSKMKTFEEAATEYVRLTRMYDKEDKIDEEDKRERVRLFLKGKNHEHPDETFFIREMLFDLLDERRIAARDEAFSDSSH